MNLIWEVRSLITQKWGKLGQANPTYAILNQAKPMWPKTVVICLTPVWGGYFLIVVMIATVHHTMIMFLQLSILHYSFETTLAQPILN